MGYNSDYIQELRETIEELEAKLELFNEIGTEAQNTIRRIDISINRDNYREGLSDGEVLDFVYDEVADYNRKMAKE